jgi:hypothetical protein
MSRRLLPALLLAATLSTTGCQRLIQQTSLLDKARSQYYSLSAAGVTEFHCDVAPDWTAFLTSVNHQPPADTPWHRYLQQAHLSFSAPLTGATTVQWSAPAAVPAGFESSAQKMQSSFHDMVAGFLEAWIPSLNNMLLPAIPVSPITPRGTGYTLTEHDLEGRVTDVTMDSQLRITHLSTRAPKFNAEIDTRFVPSPGGLLLAELDTLDPVTSPATTPANAPVNAPAGHTIMRTTYSTVSGAQIPSSLLILTQDSQIPMRFTNCGVRR